MLIVSITIQRSLIRIPNFPIFNNSKYFPIFTFPRRISRYSRNTLGYTINHKSLFQKTRYSIRIQKMLNTEDWVDRGWDRGPPPRSANRLTLWTDSAGLKFRGTVGQLCTGSQWGIAAGTGSRWFVGDHKGRHSARATCTSSHIIYAYLSCEEWEFASWFEPIKGKG